MSLGHRLLPWAEIGVAVIASLLAVGLSYRFCTEAGPLWRDEVSTVNLAIQPRYADVLGALGLDSAPALYPTVLRLWTMPWGAGDRAFRFFGLIVAVGTVGMVWATARGLLLTTPLLTLILFDLHGAVLQTLGSMKPYGFGALLVILAFGAIGRLVARPTLQTAAWAAVTAILAVQTLYHNALLLLAMCAAAATVRAVARDWRGAGLSVATGGAAVLSLLPYGGVILRSRDWRPLNQIETSVGQLLGRVVELFADWNGWLVVVWALVWAAGVLAVVVTFRAGGRWTPDQGRIAYASVTVVFAGLIYLGFLWLVGRSAEPWHLVPLIAIVALSLDVVVSHTSVFRWSRLVLGAGAAAVLIPISVQWVGVRQTNIDVLAKYLEVSSGGRDVIVVNPWYLAITFNRYYRGTVPWITVPPIEDVRFHRYDLVKQRMMSPEAVALVHQAMTTALKSGGRLWLVGGALFAPTDQPVEILPPAPGAPSRWRDAPYYRAWSLGVGRFLQNHAVRLSRVPARAGQPVWQAEGAVLLMAEGWQNPGGGR